MSDIVAKLLRMTDAELLVLTREELEEMEDQCSNLLSEYTGMSFMYDPDSMPVEVQKGEQMVLEQYRRIGKILQQKEK